MDNSYFIYSTRDNVAITRFHICTWEKKGTPSFIEFGIELVDNTFENTNTIALYLCAPFISRKTKCYDLSDRLSDKKNCRYIFNSIVKNSENVGQDNRDGNIITFNDRDTLTILPLSNQMIFNGYIYFRISKPTRSKGNFYCRLLLSVENQSIAIKKKNGLSKINHIYDVKVNETRNLPQYVYDLRRNESLEICKVDQVFCLHAVSDKLELNYVDSKKLKNIRKIEADIFKNYLKDYADIGNDYDIVFMKAKADEGFSFFTLFTEETIGRNQILFALGANLICSLLFAIASFRTSSNMEIPWYKQIPIEYYIAFLFILFCIIYLVSMIIRQKRNTK